MTDPEQRLSELLLSTAAKRYQPLVEWNDTQAEYPKDKCIHQLFEAQAERTPEAVAVVFEDQQLTYRELNAQANQLAHYLRKRGVEPEVLVGICVERSLEMVVGLLGILKAGGSYVPLDPDYPKERLAFMLEDADVPVILTQQRLIERLPQHGAKVIALDAQGEVIARETEENPVSGVTTENLAYAIFTSGSTGRPKGVQISHASVVNLLGATHSSFHFDERDVWTVVHSYAFDFSVWEIWGCILHGGRLVVVPLELTQSPAAFYDLLRRERVTVLNQTPSAIRQLIAVKQRAADTARHLSLRLIICGGEAFPQEVASSLLEWDVPVWNFYGPTETTVWAAINQIESIDSNDRSIPIVRPLANTQIFILNSHLQPVPTGVPGELHIGGVGLARGYLKRPELTAEKFIPNPFNTEPGARLYKTGDLARYRPDGNIEFLRRIDHQVKIRGFRIELGEIETVLCQHPAVQQAVVLAREDISREKQLVAYLVPKESTPTTNDLRSFLQQKLPDYMVPSFFVFLDVLPLTPNGKVDRSALPAPSQTRPDLAAPFVAPRTPVEEVLEDIWAEVLGLTQIGIHDNFLELGGHSLRATQIVSRVRDAFQVELPLPCLFATPTIAGLAKIIEGSNAREQNLSFPPIQPIPRSDDLRLSFSQERAWFIQQLDPANLAYNFQATLRFTGSLDVAALEQSLNEMVRRHEILRTTFPAADGRPTQVIHPFQPGHLPVVDLQALCESEREAQAQRWIREELRKPFDLTQLPMIRWILLRLSEQETILVHVEHHLVHDGWSFTVFLREVLELYKAFSAGNPSPLPELPIQFADFAHWQRQWLKGKVAEFQLAYWKQKLAGNLPVLALPTDRPRPAVQSFGGAAPRVELPLHLYESLRAFSRREGVTLFMTMLSAFLTLLHRYTGQNDICVGSGIANRRWRETEGLIGMIINNVVLRTDLSGNPRFRELLRQVREVTLAASAHQDLPFEQLVQALQPERDLSRNPLFQAMFSFHDSPMPDLVLPGVSINLVEVLCNGSAKFDLDVIVIPRIERSVRKNATAEGDGITLIWEYSTDLFDAATITRMVGHYQTLLEGILVDATQPVSDLPLLTEPERQQVFVEWNDTKRNYPCDRCIHELFEAQVERTPGAVAIVFQDKYLTYGELNRRANQLAHYLKKLGVGPEVLVGICMERSLEMIVGLLGILKAGGAYVPLDPAYPKERLAFMLEDTQAPALLTQEHLIIEDGRSRIEDSDSRFSILDPQFKVLCLDREWENIARESPENPPSEATADNLAYVIYTSGSTGKPKGVGIPHRGVVRLLFGIDYVYLGAEQTFLQLAPISFDASTFEIWGALLHGARCVLFPGTIPHPGELGEVIHKHGISTLWLTASLFNAVIDQAPEALSRVRQLLIGGEALSAPHVRRALSQLNMTEVINGYGPTETTTFACCYHIARQLNETTCTIPIGRPIANTEVYLLDSNLAAVPVGVTGEVYVGGDGLARGYLNGPELTAERFIPNPFSREPGARLYKTGDLARYLPDGNIEFLGRIDHQVKIRGFRIELEEIETVLADHPGVHQSVAIVREDEPGKNRLAAYVVAKPEFAPTTSDLRGFLKDKLPEYMVPSAFVMLDALPLTPNGKLDRKALPAPDPSRPDLETRFVAPRTPVEETLARIWTEVLKLEAVGVHDNFFDLGGHSLLATQVVSRMRHALQVEFPLRALFENPTVANLAVHITQIQARRALPKELADMLAGLESLSDEEAERLLAQESPKGI